MDYFYDGQTRRYLLQFMRIFSDIKVRNGPDANGLYTIQSVPIMYGDPSSMVANLIKGASENTLMPSPMFSAWIENIKMAPERRQDTQFVGKINTMEREFDQQTQTYGEGPGVRYQIERYMPVPYDMTFRLDLWTTNIDTKLQISEQIEMIFNPSIQIQQNDNLLDWTSIFEVWLEDITWTNRSVPQGADDTRDVMSFKFKVPIWINPPAKVKRSSLISEIVNNIYATSDVAGIEAMVDQGATYDPFSQLAGLPIQIITTAGNYKISVERGATSDEITLLNAGGNVDPIASWANLIAMYGSVEPGVTKIRLKLDPNIEVNTSDIIGTIIQDPTRQNVMLFTPDSDTLPATTILPIAEIIDPTEVSPGNGLPAAAVGQRYLLTSHDSIGEEPAIPPGVSTSPWGSGIVAYPNDIIEYNGISWIVIFDSRNATGKNYVVNTSNSSQYLFENHVWTYTYYGVFAPGYWRLENLIKAPCGTIANIDSYL